MDRITKKVLDLINSYELKSSYPFENAKYLYVGYIEYNELMNSKDSFQFITLYDGRIAMFKYLTIVRVQLSSHLNISRENTI